jgi:hypothetical protein
VSANFSRVHGGYHSKSIAVCDSVVCDEEFVLAVEFLTDVADFFNYLPPFLTLRLRINYALYGYVYVTWIPNSFPDCHIILVSTSDIKWHFYIG